MASSANVNSLELDRLAAKAVPSRGGEQFGPTFETDRRDEQYDFHIMSGAHDDSPAEVVTMDWSSATLSFAELCEFFALFAVNVSILTARTRRTRNVPQISNL